MLRKWCVAAALIAAGVLLPALSPAAEGERTPQEGMTGDRFMIEDLYFDYRDYSLSPRAQEVLQELAQWLKENPEVIVIIEGHTDDRNGRLGNLAFGEYRAGSVKSYLLRQGIDGGRLKTISYGEERPAVAGRDEQARAKNRRVHFVIIENY
jgi:peptidoglycan-associated lipoprotein